MGGIDCWEYAKQLARIKEIRVVYADFDAFEEEAALKTTGYASIKQMGHLGGLHDSRIKHDVKLRQRSLKAVNTLKNDALAQLGAKANSDRKPKLVLLMGIQHRVDVVDIFNRMYLETTVTELEMSSEEDRFLEHFGAPLGSLATRDQPAYRKVFGLAGSYVLSAMPGILNIFDRAQDGSGVHAMGAENVVAQHYTPPMIQHGGRVTRPRKPSKEDLGPEDFIDSSDAYEQ